MQASAALGTPLCELFSPAAKTYESDDADGILLASLQRINQRGV